MAWFQCEIAREPSLLVANMFFSAAKCWVGECHFHITPWATFRQRLVHHFGKLAENMFYFPVVSYANPMCGNVLFGKWWQTINTGQMVFFSRMFSMILTWTFPDIHIFKLFWGCYKGSSPGNQCLDSLSSRRRDGLDENSGHWGPTAWEITVCYWFYRLVN